MGFERNSWIGGKFDVSDDLEIILHISFGNNNLLYAMARNKSYEFLMMQ